MVISDLLNVWISVKTPCKNGRLQDATCGKPHDEVRTFIAMISGTNFIWQFIIGGYPSLDETDVRTTNREAQAKS
jgi:hypothetical protein